MFFRGVCFNNSRITSGFVSLLISITIVHRVFTKVNLFSHATWSRQLIRQPLIKGKSDEMTAFSVGPSIHNFHPNLVGSYLIAAEVEAGVIGKGFIVGEGDRLAAQDLIQFSVVVNFDG